MTFDAALILIAMLALGILLVVRLGFSLDPPNSWVG
jgi:hypothetical protein